MPGGVVQLMQAVEAAQAAWRMDAPRRGKLRRVLDSYETLEIIELSWEKSRDFFHPVYTIIYYICHIYKYYIYIYLFIYLSIYLF